MKRGTPTHPKMIDLAKRLRIPLPHAVGIMEMLWHFTAQYAPAGDIGKFDDARIATAVCWSRRSPRVLIEALVGCGWLDPDSRVEGRVGGARLTVHDWVDHADRGVRLHLQNHGLSFHEASGKHDNHNSENGRPIAGRGKAEAMAEAEAEATQVSEKDKRFWIAKAMLEFPGARVLGKPPDDLIVSQCYDLAHGDIDALGRAFRALHLTGQKPTISWAWFPKVLPKYMENGK